MAKTWTYKYGGNTIVVTNSMFSGEELTVNGRLQDKQVNLFSAQLTGKLDTGEEIKANIGGTWTMQCRLFINHVLQEPIPK